MCWDFNFGGRGISALLFASFSLTFFPGLHIFKCNGLIEIWVSIQGTLNQLMKPEVICLLNQLILLNLVKGPLYLNIIYIVKFNCKPNSILKKILGLHFNNINIAKCTSYKKVKKIIYLRLLNIDHIPISRLLHQLSLHPMYFISS